MTQIDELNELVPESPVLESSELSYASPSDHAFVRGLIRTVEFLAGTRRLQKLYDEIHEEQHPTSDVWGRALQKLKIQIDYDSDILESVPSEGPIVFVANHPYGILDGLIMCHLVSRVRKDFFVLVNESVMPQPLVEEHLLAIDFHPTKEALKTNLKTKRLTTERLRNGESLAIFPAGIVATADKPFGQAPSSLGTLSSAAEFTKRIVPSYPCTFTDTTAACSSLPAMSTRTCVWAC